MESQAFGCRWRYFKDDCNQTIFVPFGYDGRSICFYDVAYMYLQNKWPRDLRMCCGGLLWHKQKFLSRVLLMVLLRLLSDFIRNISAFSLLSDRLVREECRSHSRIHSKAFNQKYIGLSYCYYIGAQRTRATLLKILKVVSTKYLWMYSLTTCQYRWSE